LSARVPDGYARRAAGRRRVAGWAAARHGTPTALPSLMNIVGDAFAGATSRKS
jgi:hypothetical protein